MTDDPNRARWAYVYPRTREGAWQVPWVLTPTARDDVVKIVVEKPCRCGTCLGDIFSSWRYNDRRGPGYTGSKSLASFAGWDPLINEGKATTDEQKIMVAMSANEGNLDAVQSYDSEVLTAGAMQKTINPQGYGELPTQVAKFKQRHPELYQSLFVACGWEIRSGQRGARMYYRNKTAQELKALLRQGFEVKLREKMASEPLASVVNAISSREYQTLQVLDFIERLEQVKNIVPSGYQHRIGAYLTANLSRAVALDHHINRPAYVARDFAKALDSFFVRNPHASTNPVEWAGERAAYERSLLEIYGPGRVMTESLQRYNKLKQKL
jgi:hypothetical protein